MTHLIKLLPLLLMTSCQVDSSDDLEKNKTIVKVFNESEIRDLNIILDFFENQICRTEQIDNELKFDCYKSFFKRLDSLEATGSMDSKISFDLQKIMYEKINLSTFNTIWEFGKASIQPPKDTLKQISINYDGKYVKFLKEMSKENKVLKNYYESFMLAGTISPSSIAHLLKMYNEYDIKDIRVRLLIAVHYLTLNDSFERKEKYED